MPEGHLDDLHPQNKRLREYFGLEGATEEQTARGRAAYYGLVTFADERIGQVLDALERSGQAENTVVVYVADHGEMMGEHGLWWKCTYYEGSSRVPFIVSWPKRFEAGPPHCDHLTGGPDPDRDRPGRLRGGRDGPGRARADGPAGRQRAGRGRRRLLGVPRPRHRPALADGPARRLQALLLPRRAAGAVQRGGGPRRVYEPGRRPGLRDRPRRAGGAGAGELGPDQDRSDGP